MKKKRLLSLAIFFLGIGYASISTTLNITGDLKLALNYADFDVRITKATLEGNAATISEDGKTVTFNTSSLSTVRNKTTLDFTTINNSEQYDAEVNLVCTAEEEKQECFQMTSNPITIAGKTSGQGQVAIELIKEKPANTGDAFVCTLNTTPKERTAKAETPFATDSWATIVETVKTGTYPYQVGDTKEVDLGETFGKHTLRVANTSECINGEVSETACGFVLEFADVITTHNMNLTGTNVGGWPASAMRKYVNEDVYNALPSDLKGAIIDTTVVSGHGSTSGESNFTSTNKLYLLSTKEVYGEGTSSYDTATSETRQLDYYRENEVTTSNYSGAIKKNGSTNSWWWLRAAFSNYTDRFHRVYSDGYWYYGTSADFTGGVAPAFRIQTPAPFATDSWATIAETVKSGIYPYQVGDTKTVDMGSLGTHTLRVANTSPCINGETSETACGFVLEFADVIIGYEMNSNNLNAGGWPATSMREYVNSVIYNALPSDLKATIVDTKVVSSHGSTEGEENFTSTDKLYLLSTKEVYGTSASYDTVNSETRQLDYYREHGVTTSNYSGAIKQRNGSSDSWWWLRSAISSNTNYFYDVNSSGYSATLSAGSIDGVSPAFRIA